MINQSINKMANNTKQFAGILINKSATTPTTTVSLFSDKTPLISTFLDYNRTPDQSGPTTPEDSKRKKVTTKASKG